MARAFYWLGSFALLAVLNYFYNPGLFLAAIGTVFSIGLLILSVWAVSKIGDGPKVFIGTALIAIASGLMISKGFDVAYALLGAPEGSRFSFIFEVGLFALVLALGAGASKIVPRTKK